jgi:lipoprotein-anchoring transpeptidase ErfK/SrfK
MSLRSVRPLLFGCSLVIGIAVGPTDAAAEVVADTATELRLEVVRSERVVHVYLDDRRVATHEVAVGQDDHRTPTGEWRIHRVDWNPDWTPPDSEWSEDSDYKEPGHPDNPMGRARLVFDPPYSIHGTDALDSLGEAASHGSIRVANDAVIELGEMVMRHGGASRDDGWLERVLADPTSMEEVPIPEPVRIVVRD